MSYFSQAMAAGTAGAVDLIAAGDFLRVLSAPVEDLKIRFYFQGQEVAIVEDVGAGYWERLKFDKVRVESTGGGLVKIVTRLGAEVGYDRAIGSVAIGGVVDTEPAAVAFTQASAAVTNANGVLKAANAARRYLLVQNNDAAGIVYLNISGAAATAANGIKLGPGQAWESPGVAPSGAINAIGSIANNPNVVVVEA